ncbi:16S rRNA (guanine(966)-N(2))-methyltransferase RsmD [Candidatus Profftia sp. (ex Adelges kitamiensis)]|uniref:16S rRNA (guanine(966)-N(2))-methyltransferase RsmD n=1 Tax=Candidatus Profftia sp. (ex Adelges kitamiensis) TaxID=2864218 RepID=UPI001CE38F68|nr:16S rRNA (guanine(966)-N(2))-methyltransferase RsmD [Candidatus Profftia sp. (ex Adelges kitamiensis)]
MIKNFTPRPRKKIRIISGLWHGRKISIPSIPGLRPTTDRIRETLFNWLTPVIYNARCLDCFSGSGVLGLEAISRQASHATLLEYNSIVAAQLKKNVALINTDKVIVQNIDTLQWLLYPSHPYKIVFLDPPFRKNLLDKTINLLENNGWLSDNSYIYVETEVDNTTVEFPINWSVHRKKVAGQVSYSLYKRFIV